MIDAQNLILFLLAGITLNLTPGPDILYIVTRSVSQGRKAGIVSALGISAGGVGHTLAAALGLSALVMLSTVAFMILKYAGAAYLVYLGVRAFVSRSPLTVQTAKKESLPRLFQHGALTNLLNPKVAIFFISFLPQFIDPAVGSVALQSVILGSLFIMTGTIVGVGVALLFGRISLAIINRPWFDRFRRWFSGTVFIALGAWLAFEDAR